MRNPADRSAGVCIVDWMFRLLRRSLLLPAVGHFGNGLQNDRGDLVRVALAVRAELADRMPRSNPAPGRFTFERP